MRHRLLHFPLTGGRKGAIMATEDRNGDLHSEKNGRFVAKGTSEAAKREEAERIYNSDGVRKNRLPVRISLDFFSERGIKSESEFQLNKGIRSLEKRIAEHEDKIKNQPNSLDVEHWKKELKVFKENIKNRLLELKKRKDKK